MGANTPGLALPYPTGTDRVADGDNAMQALAERIEARMPWGAPANWYAQYNGGNIPFGSAARVDLGPTVTIAAVAGRRYRFASHMRINGNAAGNAHLFVVETPSNTDGAAHSFWYPSTAYQADMWLEFYSALSAGNHTYKLQAQTSGAIGCNAIGTTTVPIYLMIQDVGPST
jgi:hypothetical protein